MIFRRITIIYYNFIHCIAIWTNQASCDKIIVVIILLLHVVLVKLLLVFLA